MNIFDLFTARAISLYWKESVSNRIPYLGSGFFPPKKKAGLDLKWIKGKKGLPITLMPSAFDAKARFRNRIGVSETITEMPFFREGFLLKEKDRQEILRAKDSSDPYVAAVLDEVFNDAANLLHGAEVVPERMIMQLLAPVDGTPGIAIVANGMDYTYNYDPDGEFQQNNFRKTAVAWSDPVNSTPLTDLRNAIDKVEEDTGVRPGIALMSKKTLNYLIKNEEIKHAILAQNLTANIMITDQVVHKIVSDVLGLTIIPYNKKYVDDNGATQQFYPDDLVTLLPDGPLGNTWYGTTPEEADLMASSKAKVEIVNTGVALTTITHEHPVNIETLASEIVLPSFERMDEVFVLNVAGGGIPQP